MLQGLLAIVYNFVPAIIRPNSRVVQFYVMRAVNVQKRFRRHNLYQVGGDKYSQKASQKCMRAYHFYVQLRMGVLFVQQLRVFRCKH